MRGTKCGATTTCYLSNRCREAELDGRANEDHRDPEFDSGVVGLGDDVFRHGEVESWTRCIGLAMFAVG